jgi:hypothetical protein
MGAKKSRVDKNWFKDSTSVEEMSRKKFGFETADHITIDDLPNWISFAKAAEKLDCCVSTLKGKAQRKEIIAKKIGGKWKMPTTELARLMTEAA